MKPIVMLAAFLLLFTAATAQKPKDGTYTYTIAWAEWGGRSAGATCTVVIKGNHVRVLNDEKSSVTGKKGDIYAEGILMKHKKTGQWIIGKSDKDKEAPEVGGCTGGPPVIDLVLKKFWSC